MKLTPGDIICILVNGQPVDTEVDDHGVQRFIVNEVTDWLVDSGQIDLNDMKQAFFRGSFSLGSYLEFYMSLGYPICGLEEVFGEGSEVADHCGQVVEILNSIWGNEEETIH